MTTNLQEAESKLIPFKGDALTLTENEAKRLAELESQIERSNADRGRALREIRDGYLYRATHPNFEMYLKERWGMSRARAYQLIDFAIELDLSTMVDKPKNERQFRAKKAAAKKLENTLKPATAPDEIVKETSDLEPLLLGPNASDAMRNYVIDRYGDVEHELNEADIIAVDELSCSGINNAPDPAPEPKSPATGPDPEKPTSISPAIAAGSQDDLWEIARGSKIPVKDL